MGDDGHFNTLNIMDGYQGQVIGASLVDQYPIMSLVENEKLMTKKMTKIRL